MSTKKQTVSLYNGEVTVNFNPNARNRYSIGDHSPVGVTTVIGQTIHKEGLQLWAMHEALDYIKERGFFASEYEIGTIVPAGFSGMEPFYIIHSGHLEEASKAHTKKSDKGKDIGTQVHDWIEGFLNSLPNNYELDNIEFTTPNKDVEKPVQAFLSWYEKTRPKILGTEQIVYSRSLDYAGTFDGLFNIDGKIYLIDIKTSNKSRTAPLGIYDSNFIQLGAYSVAYTEETKKYASDLMVINVGKDGTLNTLSASDLGLSVEDCENSWKNTLELYRFINPLAKQIKERK